jgi:hypothetical protein
LFGKKYHATELKYPGSAITNKAGVPDEITRRMNADRAYNSLSSREFSGRLETKGGESILLSLV